MAGAVTEKTHGQRSARAAIELFDRGARIAILTRHKGRHVVSALVEVAFPAAAEGKPLPASAKAAAIREALRSHGWRLRQIMLILPKNLVTMRLVMLPTITDAELVEMARFEAQKHIPFNVERHVIAHAVLRKEGVEGSRTLIVAVDRAALEEPMAVCREARLDISSVCVSSLALVEALLFDPPAGHSEQTFALVNLGWSAVDITIVSDGIVRFTRSGTIGVEKIIPLLQQAKGTKEPLTRVGLGALDAVAPQDFFEGRSRPVHRQPAFSTDDFALEDLDNIPQKPATALAAVGSETAGGTGQVDNPSYSGPAGEIAKWLGRLVQEIQRTYTFAAREFECPELQTVYLAGIGSYITNMNRYLEQNLHCPVTVINPPASIEFAAAKEQDLREAWREFAITIGAAAGASLPPINLLPPEYTQALLVRAQRRALAITGTLAFLLVVAGIVLAVRWVFDQRHQLEFYQAHNATLAPRVKNMNDRERRYKIVQEIVKDPRSAGVILELLSRLGLVEQKKITLLEYKYIKGDKVQLEGHALTYKDLDLFNDELAKLGSAPDRTTTGTEQTRTFEVVATKSRPLATLPGTRGTVVKFALDCLFPKSEGR